jgi:four helix bundle protein
MVNIFCQETVGVKCAYHSSYATFVICNKPASKGSGHLCGQIVRSGTAPPLMYGEACSAEPVQDFIHKMGIALKELREKRMSSRMTQMMKYIPEINLKEMIDENDKLIRILGSSINTQ